MRAEARAAVAASKTIRAALNWGRRSLAPTDTADLDAQALLAHELGVGRTFLFARPESVLSDAQVLSFQAAVTRRAAGEPVAYITGLKGFYDIELAVSPAVLIPRPETELLLEQALRLTQEQPDVTAADIGTGSGALAIAYARRRPAAAVYASEISAEALALASGNAERAGAKVTVLPGDLAEPLIERGVQVDLLMANLPYIATDELAALAVSQFEPRLALDGGADGLGVIRRLLEQLPRICRGGAWALLEIGADQGEAVTELVRDRLGAQPDILPDYAGLDRIARFRL